MEIMQEMQIKGQEKNKIKEGVIRELDVSREFYLHTLGPSEVMVVTDQFVFNIRHRFAKIKFLEEGRKEEENGLPVVDIIGI
jgi:hypothetical protein